MTPDEDQLRLLSIFHYVVAGIAGLFSLFPVFHIVMGAMIVSGRFDNAAGPPGDDMVGWLFIALGLMFLVARARVFGVYRAGRAVHFAATLLHVLPRRGRRPMRVHPVRHGPRRVHHRRAAEAERTAAVWQGIAARQGSVRVTSASASHRAACTRCAAQVPSPRRSSSAASSRA